MGPPRVGLPLGGAGRPHLAVAWPRFGVESSRVFWNLLKLISLWISVILFDNLILLDGFLK